MKLVQIDVDDFERAADATRLKERARSMAKAVLVDGKTPADAARAFSASWTRAREAVKAVEKAYAALQMERGLCEVTLTLPTVISSELNEYSVALLKSVDRTENEAATAAVARSIRTATERLKVPTEKRAHANSLQKKETPSEQARRFDHLNP
jgi:hypothetical protein